MSGNTAYYVSFANTTSLALSTTSGGANVNITGFPVINIVANTNGFSNTDDVIYVDSADSKFNVGDQEGIKLFNHSSLSS